MRRLLGGSTWILSVAFMLIGLSSLALAVSVVSWKKSEVVPVVLVKPAIGGFAPTEGSAIGNTWEKEEVKPVLLVKPGIGGFIPRDGSSIGNSWDTEEVFPVVLVETASTGFVPHRALAPERSTEPESAPATEKGKAEKRGDREKTKTPPIIESSVDGAFSGFDGDTIVKLRNGQIWEQSEYYYYYHYAYGPEVLIYKSGAGYKMKVDGIERAVGVRRLK